MAETEFTLRVERETARPSPSTVSPDDARAERQAAYAAAYQDALSRRASR